MRSATVLLSFTISVAGGGQAESVVDVSGLSARGEYVVMSHSHTVSVQVGGSELGGGRGSRNQSSVPVRGDDPLTLLYLVCRRQNTETSKTSEFFLFDGNMAACFTHSWKLWAAFTQGVDAICDTPAAAA